MKGGRVAKPIVLRGSSALVLGGDESKVYSDSVRFCGPVLGCSALAQVVLV